MPKRTNDAPTEPSSDELFQDAADAQGAEGQQDGQVINQQTDGPAIDPAVQSNGKPIGEMSGAEILALLERRRAELNQISSVAKEKGVEIPKKSKPKVSDADKLMEFFNRLGYSTGMRWWAQSRIDANVKRINPVIEALGEAWDPERHGEAVSAMAQGFREARMQTSFPSTSMPDKKAADGVPEAEVWAELQAHLRNDPELPEFVAGLLDQPAAAETEPDAAE